MHTPPSEPTEMTIRVDDDGEEVRNGKETSDATTLVERGAVSPRVIDDRGPVRCCCGMVTRPPLGKHFVIGFGSCSCSVGPHWRGLLCTYCTVIGAAMLTWERVFSRLAPPLAVPALALALVAVCALTLTGCRDPGMVSADDAPATDCEEQPGRWCDRCELFRPDGAMHCEACGVCVKQLDHHCPWMGRCVGRRNLRSFRIFNLSWLLYVCYTIGCVAYVASVPATWG